MEKLEGEFIGKITLHINYWNSSTDNQHISLKAAFFWLQPYKSQPRDPKQKTIINSYLSAFRSVKKGKLAICYVKVEFVRDVLESLKLAKLALEEQIDSALRFLSETSTGGVLELTDDDMEQSWLSWLVRGFRSERSPVRSSVT